MNYKLRSFSLLLIIGFSIISMVLFDKLDKNLSNRNYPVFRENIYEIDTLISSDWNISWGTVDREKGYGITVDNLTKDIYLVGSTENILP